MKSGRCHERRHNQCTGPRAALTPEAKQITRDLGSSDRTALAITNGTCPCHLFDQADDPAYERLMQQSRASARVERLDVRAHIWGQAAVSHWGCFMQRMPQTDIVAPAYIRPALTGEQFDAQVMRSIEETDEPERTQRHLCSLLRPSGGGASG